MLLMMIMDLVILSREHDKKDNTDDEDHDYGNDSNQEDDDHRWFSPRQSLLSRAALVQGRPWGRRRWKSTRWTESMRTSRLTPEIVLGYLDIWIFGYWDIWILGYLDIGIFLYWDIWILGCIWTPENLKNIWRELNLRKSWQKLWIANVFWKSGHWELIAPQRKVMTKVDFFRSTLLSLMIYVIDICIFVMVIPDNK